MAGAACGAENAYPSGAPDFTPGFRRGSCCPVICVSLFHVVVLSFVFWVLIVLFVWLLGVCVFFTSYPICVSLVCYFIAFHKKDINV